MPSIKNKYKSENASGIIEAIKKCSNSQKKTIVIFIMMLIVSLMAISNHIGIGEDTHVIKISDEITSYLSSFRASGRFFWINYYLIYCIIFIVVVKFYQRKFAIILLIVAIIHIFVLDPPPPPVFILLIISGGMGFYAWRKSTA